MINEYLSLVGVGVFCVNSFVVLDVLESLIHETTVAALITILAAAVNQVLLAERRQITSLAKVLTFQSTGLTDGE